MGSLGDEDSQATTGTSDQYREGREVLEEGPQDPNPGLGHYRAFSKKPELNEHDYMRHRHYVQGWSGNRIAKHLNELEIKGKLGGSWTSSMILRTCRYKFHENRRMFKQPKWWGKEPYHDSASWR